MLSSMVSGLTLQEKLLYNKNVKLMFLMNINEI